MAIDRRNEENVYKLKMKTLYENVLAELYGLTGLQDDYFEFRNGRIYNGFMDTDTINDPDLYTWNFVGIEEQSGLDKWFKLRPQVMVRVETYSRLTNKLSDERYFIIDHKGNTERWTRPVSLSKGADFSIEELHIPEGYKSYKLILDASEVVLKANSKLPSEAVSGDQLQDLQTGPGSEQAA